MRTVRDNLTSFLLAKPGEGDGARDGEMRAALEALGMGHKSLDEEVSRLSAGERQIVALARVLLRRPRLVVLDEATSSVDEAGEDRVFKALFAMQACTFVCVLHRLARLEDFDKVAFMRAGRIEAFGGARSLFLDKGMDAREWFARMINA